MRLTDLGWTVERAAEFEPWAGKPDVEPGRVLIEFNYLYRVFVEAGEIEAVLSGRIKHHATSRGELPAVGDWVAIRRRPGEDRGAIVGILPRRSRFSRRMAGQVTDEQVVAANVDVAFVVMGLDNDFNLRRLERYLLLAHESGAEPVVLLTKPDLADDAGLRAANVQAVTAAVPVHVVSPKFNEGLAQVASYLTAGRTGALLGSSGVGKTTIINRLIGADVRKTQDVRISDSRGRHTTTHRELVVLPDGGLIIDTPGMRELQLWDVSDAVSDAFDDVATLAAECRFTDCRHRDEPQCAVKAAVAAGHLSGERLDSYLKLQDELAFLARQQDERALLEQKRRAKQATKAVNRQLRSRGR